MRVITQQTRYRMSENQFLFLLSAIYLTLALTSPIRYTSMNAVVTVIALSLVIIRFARYSRACSVLFHIFISLHDDFSAGNVSASSLSVDLSSGFSRCGEVA